MNRWKKITITDMFPMSDEGAPDESSSVNMSYVTEDGEESAVRIRNDNVNTRIRGAAMYGNNEVDALYNGQQVKGYNPRTP